MIGPPLSKLRSYWVRYALAFALLISMIAGAQFVSWQRLESSARDARIIRMSDSQKMLSQRLAFMSHRLHVAGDVEVHGRTILTDLEQFFSSHKALVDIAEEVPTADAIYATGEEAGLDARVRQFVADIRLILTLDPADPRFDVVLQRIEEEASGPLLADLEAALTAFSENAQKRYDRLQILLRVFFSLTVALLIAEATLVFWPTHRNMNRALRIAEERSRRLEERNTQLVQLSERLEHSALHDQLTGLANRKKLYRNLEQRLEDRRSAGDCQCVMHLDLDRFKEINDTLGHAVGDIVLKRVAAAMRSLVRAEDLVARIGGDEFVIVAGFTGANPSEQADRIATSVIRCIRAPMVIEGHNCIVGASVGYTFSMSDQDTPERLIANADIALYEAKRAGKGIAVKFDPSMRQGIERRHELMQDLERAIGQDEFVPYFQPAICLKSGSVVGFEALTRWEHPERGTLHPSEFVHLAEEAGLLRQIETRTMILSLDALTALRCEGWHIPSLALNTSTDSLTSPDYTAELEEALAERGLAHVDITIEVVERTLINARDSPALKTLRTLSERGCAVELDDFGTGYASLSMLATLDLSGLKIDRSLIADLRSTRTCQIVEAVTGLGKSMGLRIVAEGVEHPYQFATLRKLGCDVVQGFGIAKPLSLSEARVWLHDYGSHPGVADNLAAPPRGA
ncbi:putative bifunctional diguanylate cyclase/phosphodiesterase [Roseisalinus antarcticus]|uniref:Cyclic di-GMP phosphodiesterase Gmr n=1 Tax=Roseisalinus antarcticus TaxID=254357 RepID=A0A1Y5T3I4_9RHOB|nr:EAL domain-containing protein [Roseisalinus antarcticus]SLN53197.1 Cyclic di-GMP phosphodiesterase Gmr [Roseisalinus antarcticus]